MSTNYRPHFLSALSRSLFTNSSQIFINSAFVSSLGGKSYSDLFFFASMFSIFYYIFFALKGEKQAYNLYRIVLLLTLLGLGLFFVQPHVKPVLYYFGVAVVVVDLIGTNLGPIVLQASVNPTIFREIFQKIVSYELYARITAAALIWIFSQFHLSIWYYLIGCASLTAHLTLFSSAVQRVGSSSNTSARNASAGSATESTRGSTTDSAAGSATESAAGSVTESKAGSATLSAEKHSYIDSIKKSLRFIMSNPLARVALTVMVWTHVTKFLVEYLFYQVTASEYIQANKIASFVSIITMSMIMLSLLVQKAVGKKLTEHWQLSSLFSCQPINILLLGGLALLVKPFWPLVILMLSYQCINRSIQLPVSRQCLVPVPRSQRAAIASLFSLIMAIAAVVTSGIMSALKGYLHLQDFLLMLLFLSGILFFLITRLDAYYIRNLWSFYREARSGTWTDQPFNEGLVAEELSLQKLEKTTSSTSNTLDEQSISILDTYAKSFDKDSLQKVTQEHKQTLRKPGSAAALSAMRLAFTTDFPWFRNLFFKALTHKDPTIRTFADRVQIINTGFVEMSEFSAVFRKRIKILALELLESESQDSQDTFQRLKAIPKSNNHKAADSLVGVLSDARFTSIRPAVFACVLPEAHEFSLRPIVDEMYARTYSAARQHRELLAQLDFGKLNSELVLAIDSNLSAIERAGFSLMPDSANSQNNQVELQHFMHTLFLEEYRLAKHGLDKSFTDSISEFESLSSDEAALLIDMHLEYLKSSPLFGKWKQVMRSH